MLGRIKKSLKIANVDYSTHLSENFSISEFEKSQTASRRGIVNKMGPVELENARRLAKYVLQPVRNHFGPTIITSGFRGKKLNRAIRGSKYSQHMDGEASDIEVIGTSNYELARWIEKNLDFDQLILEGYTPGEPNSGWVHVSYVDDELNRQEVLTATFDDGGVSYQNGLVK